MRHTGTIAFASLAVTLAACGGDSRTTGGMDAGRDLTTPAIPAADEAPVVSFLEREPPRAVDPVPIYQRTVEIVVATPAATPVVFTDAIDLPPRPVDLGPRVPVLGAGSGTALAGGRTITAYGPPVSLGGPAEMDESPWPDAKPGEYPSFDRSRAGTGLVIGDGTHGGACPGGGRAFVGQFYPTR